VRLRSIEPAELGRSADRLATGRCRKQSTVVGQGLRFVAEDQSQRRAPSVVGIVVSLRGIPGVSAI
jgi:hypothetical protein